MEWTGSAKGELSSQPLKWVKNATVNHSAIHHRKPICPNQSCLVNSSPQVRRLIDIQRRQLFALLPGRYCIPLKTVHIIWGVGVASLLTSCMRKAQEQNTQTQTQKYCTDVGLLGEFRALLTLGLRSNYLFRSVADIY